MGFLKDIGLGIAFFGVIGMAVGSGAFIGIMVEQQIFVFLNLILFLCSGPIFGSIVGGFQGVRSKGRPSHSAGAGLIAGPIGFFLAAVIILMLMDAATVIKYPPTEQYWDETMSEEEETMDDDEMERNEFLGFVALLLLPISLTCGLAAFLTADPAGSEKGEKDKGVKR
jgi:hypothetical protein